MRQGMFERSALRAMVCVVLFSGSTAAAQAHTLGAVAFGPERSEPNATWSPASQGRRPLPAPFVSSVDPPNPERWRAQRRARLMLAVGAGLTLGSALHLAIASQHRTCRNERYPEEVHERTGSLKAAGVIGGVGLGLTLGGGIWLPLAAQPESYRAPRGQRLAIALSAVGSLLVSQVVLWSTYGFQTLSCVELSS